MLNNQARRSLVNTVISLFGFSSVFFVSMAFAVIGGLCVLLIRKVQI